MGGKKLTIAIDGPAGAGKSTVARQVAAQLGYIYVDSGAFYRAVTWHCIQRGVDLDREEDVARAIQDVDIKIETDDRARVRVFVADQDVTDAIRGSAVAQAVSRVSAHPAVRAEILSSLRALSASGGVVMDGRDIGTVVLPHADAKFFLTATPQVRAERRLRELIAKGEKASLDQVLQDIVERDQRDSQRSSAPLRQAGDAQLIDTTTRTIEEVVEEILKVCRQRGADPCSTN